MGSDEVLARLHGKELEMLVVFDKVCRDNGLEYMLDSGTALGAVRHGGFIPWDDDVDVAMPRKDYERLEALGQSVFPEGYFLQNKTTEPNYRRNCAKLRLKGTYFEEGADSQLMENGIFIDIFPFDNLPSCGLLASAYLYLSRVKFYPIRTWYCGTPSRSRLLRPLSKLMLKMSEAEIKRREESYVRYCRRFENMNTSKCTCFFWRMTQSKNYIFSADKLWPSKDISFEGHAVRIANDTDHYLKTMYGDYMKLPPEDKRNCHLKGRIDFGDEKK